MALGGPSIQLGTHVKLIANQCYHEMDSIHFRGYGSTVGVDTPIATRHKQDTVGIGVGVGHAMH